MAILNYLDELSKDLDLDPKKVRSIKIVVEPDSEVLVIVELHCEDLPKFPETAIKIIEEGGLPKSIENNNDVSTPSILVLFIFAGILFSLVAAIAYTGIIK